MATIDDEYSWSPPSEAELKVIEARRERNNKISSLMGQYLLKGYKMLAITCPVCDCVLLEDRSKSKYCIGCAEVDADTKKDNPAVSEEAARKAVEEIQHRQKQEKDTSNQYRPEVSHQDRAPKATSIPNGIFNGLSNGSAVTGSCNEYQNGNGNQNASPVSSISTVSSATGARQLHQNKQSIGLSIHGVDLTDDVATVLSTLRDKLVWAGGQLRATTSVHEARNIAELISEICKATSALRDL